MASIKKYDQAASHMRRPGTEHADGNLDARELIRHATLAASSHNTQPWKFCIRKDRITILPDWIRFNPVEAMHKGDGLAGRTIGQPALPTWLAKLIIGLVLTHKGQARTDAKNIRSSAGIAVFVSGRDDKPAWFEIGRAYERFALQATALNIRTAFINQPIEVRELRSQFDSWLKLEGECALLMVRFGHGSTAPFSLRRPIDDVIVVD